MNAEVRMCEYKTNFTAVHYFHTMEAKGDQKLKVNYPFSVKLQQVV